MTYTPPDLSTQPGYNEYGKNLGLGLGPLLLGLFLDCLFLGYLLQMAMHWFVHARPHEPRGNNILVTWLLLITTAMTCFWMAMAFDVFVRKFGTFSALISTQWIPYITLFQGLVQPPVLAWYCLKGFRLLGGTQSVLAMVFLIVVGSVLTMVTAMMAGIVIVRLQGNANLTNIFDLIRTSSVVFSDVLISAAITAHLFRSRTGWKQTDKLLTKLIVLFAQSAIPPTIFALGFMIVSFTDAHSLNLFWICSSKIYAITLLQLINSRYVLRKEFEDASSKWHETTFGGKTAKFLGPAVINVKTETTVDVERDPHPPTMARADPVPMGQRKRRDSLDKDDDDLSSTGEAAMDPLDYGASTGSEVRLTRVRMGEEA